MSQNDFRIFLGSFVNCLGLATPDDDSEALIYGYGALKFLMMNENILNFALDNGILQLMALHLKMINLAVRHSFVRELLQFCPISNAHRTPSFSEERRFQFSRANESHVVSVDRLLTKRRQ